jgi:hypothetical protein
MSDHDDLINVARRWQRLYNDSQAEISRLKGEVMTAAASARPNRERAENLERTARALLARAEAAEREVEHLREENARLRRTGVPQFPCSDANPDTDTSESPRRA